MTSFKHHITFLQLLAPSPHIAPGLQLVVGVCDVGAITLHELLHHHGVRPLGQHGPGEDAHAFPGHQDPTEGASGGHFTDHLPAPFRSKAEGIAVHRAVVEERMITGRSHRFHHVTQAGNLQRALLGAQAGRVGHDAVAGLVPGDHGSISFTEASNSTTPSTCFSRGSVNRREPT